MHFPRFRRAGVAGAPISLLVAAVQGKTSVEATARVCVGTGRSRPDDFRLAYAAGPILRRVRLPRLIPVGGLAACQVLTGFAGSSALSGLQRTVERSLFYHTFYVACRGFLPFADGFSADFAGSRAGRWGTLHFGTFAILESQILR